MARIADMPKILADDMRGKDYAPAGDTPLIDGPPLAKRRVAIISTAGLQRRGDRPFGLGAGDYRVVPLDASDDVVISHVSTNFDRTGFQQDTNIMFPIDRLKEMAEAGNIGSVADYHYSFMGASDPADMEEAADQIAGLLKQDQVDAVLLVPV